MRFGEQTKKPTFLLKHFVGIARHIKKDKDEFVYFTPILHYQLLDSIA